LSGNKNKALRIIDPVQFAAYLSRGFHVRLRRWSAIDHSEFKSGAEQTLPGRVAVESSRSIRGTVFSLTSGRQAVEDSAIGQNNIWQMPSQTGIRDNPVLKMARGPCNGITVSATGPGYKPCKPVNVLLRKHSRYCVATIRMAIRQV
jgi:hypothetical protein